MSDLTWLNEYIGLPYKWCGRDADGIDCYGLVALIYKEHLGIDLPDWVADEIDLKARAKRVEEVVCSGEFTSKEVPDDTDIVICYRKRTAFHIGVWFDGGVVHATETNGSIYQKLVRFEKEYGNIKYGSWRP